MCKQTDKSKCFCRIIWRIQQPTILSTRAFSLRILEHWKGSGITLTSEYRTDYYLCTSESLRVKQSLVLRFHYIVFKFESLHAVLPECIVALTRTAAHNHFNYPVCITNIIVSDKGEAKRSLPLQLIEKSSILLRQHTARVTAAHLSRVMTCVNGWPASVQVNSWVKRWDKWREKHLCMCV